MNVKRLIYVLSNLAATIFSISFAIIYLFIKPDLHQQAMSNIGASVFLALFAAAPIMGIISWVGSVSNFIKMLSSQSKKWSEPIESINPFYRFQKGSLNEAGLIARSHFLVFGATFLIAFFGEVLMIFVLSLFLK